MVKTRAMMRKIDKDANDAHHAYLFNTPETAYPLLLQVVNQGYWIPPIPSDLADICLNHYKHYEEAALYFFIACIGGDVDAESYLFSIGITNIHSQLSSEEYSTKTNQLITHWQKEVTDTVVVAAAADGEPIASS